MSTYGFASWSCLSLLHETGGLEVALAIAACLLLLPACGEGEQLNCRLLGQGDYMSRWDKERIASNCYSEGVVDGQAQMACLIMEAIDGGFRIGFGDYALVKIDEGGPPFRIPSSQLPIGEDQISLGGVGIDECRNLIEKIGNAFDPAR